MPEVTIKYKNAKALRALKDLAKMFDMVIEKPSGTSPLENSEHQVDLPITFSKNPDVRALAGIWEGRDITLEKLRKEAWGDRL